MNLVTPEFVKARGLGVGSIQDLNNHDGVIPINGCGGKIRALGLHGHTGPNPVCTQLR